ncbi:MAG: conjugal transfer protein TraB [Variovorax paradoxus]|nr:MAG: conjugal transfer protein TraB [Variovorax paradoxus]PZQ15320.1 MAG: conjugal transfer protein TraB [Variovorax paradoxus]
MPTAPGTHPQAGVPPGARWLQRLSPRQRQFALLGAILASGVLLLWLVLSFSDAPPRPARQPGTQPGDVTNIGVMPPGGQVSALDQWVGQAGRKLAQYETEREEQGRQNKDRQAFEARTMQRFAELEQRVLGAASAAPPAPVLPTPAAPAVTGPTALPPAAALPARPVAAPVSPGAMPAGPPPMLPPLAPPLPAIARVSLIDRAPAARAETPARGGTDDDRGKAGNKTIATYLPVSFTRGILLGGLDAPTGGQSQSNPHPVLIRLADNSVLPNQFRGAYRECFVVAAGYGDISSERAYLRTENLSCVRSDGQTLEVRIQGTVYGEDGKVGMRGRLITKQGQMLANALLAGVVSGIGQGLSTANTSYSSSPLGTIASTDSNADAYRAGLGSGVGKALDRLAQYYIKLAENTFPVIEVDAGRQIDVVITKGVRIDVPMTALADGHTRRPGSPAIRALEPTDDQHY